MKDIAKILFDKAEAKMSTSELTHTPSKLPDVYLVDGKHVRNLARIFNTTIWLTQRDQLGPDDQLDAFMEVTTEILEATGVDRSQFGDLEVLE